MKLRIKIISVFSSIVLLLIFANTQAFELRQLPSQWQIKGNSLSNQIRPMPASDDHCLYLNCGDLAAIEIETGTILWKYSGDTIFGRPGGSNIDSTPYLVGDMVIAGTQTGVVAVNCKTGQPIWKFQTNAWVQAPITIDRVNDRIYFSSWDKKFYAIRLSTGEKLWDSPTQNNVGIESCIKDNYIYFVDGNKLKCLNVEDGKQVARYTFPRLPISGPLASLYNSIYLWCSDGNLYELILDNGNNNSITILNKTKISGYWAYSQEERPNFSPWPQKGFPVCKSLWVGTQLILLNNRGKMICFDSEKNKRIWDFAKLKMPDVPFDFAKYGDNQLFVSLKKGAIITIDISSGSIIDRIEIPKIDYPKINCLPNSLIVIGSQNGSITSYVLK